MNFIAVGLTGDVSKNDLTSTTEADVVTGRSQLR
jgi:hypothetical protein